MDAASHLTDVVVETPKGNSNVYEWDARAQALRVLAAHLNANFKFD